MNFKLVLNNDKNSFFSIKKGTSITPVSLLEGVEGVDEIKGNIIITPNKSRERDVLFISGQSGSGKSYYTQAYASEYQKKYKKNRVFLFSTLKSDVGSIDKIKKLKKIDITNPLFIEDNIDIEELKDSLLIFDDVDNLANGQIKDQVWKIMTDCLFTGRHHNISVIVTYHTLSDWKRTRAILNECNYIVVFPSVSGSLKTLFDKYLGMNNRDVKKIMNLDTRSVTICKTYPKVILYDKGAYILRPKY